MGGSVHHNPTQDQWWDLEIHSWLSWYRDANRQTQRSLRAKWSRDSRTNGTPTSRSQVSRKEFKL